MRRAGHESALDVLFSSIEETARRP